MVLKTDFCFKTFILKSIFSFVLCYFSQVSAQTRVSGIVLDEAGQPIEFADVYFKNSRKGMITHQDGRFHLESKKTYKTLVIHYQGFQQQEIQIKNHLALNLKVVLIEGNFLDEVVLIERPKVRLKKKENPAFRILKKIWKNKRHSIKTIRSYEYKCYTSFEIGLNNMDSVFLKKVLKKDYDSLAFFLKTKKGKERFFIPTNLNEKIEHIFGDNTLKKKRIDIVAERITGIGKNSFIYEGANTFLPDFDIYKGTITIVDKQFTSPLARSGFDSYDYVLKDSIKIEDKTKYTIFFFPRRKGDLVFKGYFTVEAPQYSITKVSMRINKNVNLNLIRNLFFEKSFDIKNDSVYIETENECEIDFTLLTKGQKERGLYLKKKQFFSDYNLNSPKDKSFFDSTTVKTHYNQFYKDDAFWKSQALGNEVNETTQNTLFKIQKNKKVKRISNTFEMLSTGFIPLGNNNLQFGQYWNLFTYNNVERLRIRLGFRSFKTQNDRFRTNFFYAYGTGDGNSKAAIDFKYLLLRDPRLRLGFIVSRDFEQLGSRLFSMTELIDTYQFGRNVLISRGKNFFISDITKFSFNVECNPIKNFFIGTNFTTRHIKPANKSVFTLDYFDGSKVVTQMQDVSTSLYLNYTPKRNVFGYGVEQRNGRNFFSTISVKYTKSTKSLFSDFDYDKIQVFANLPHRFGKFGIFRSTIELGKTFGTVPLPLLDPIPSNQGYSLVSRAFSLLNYYDFITDAYIMGHFEYNFDGFIINRIPLIRHLKLKSLLTFRAAYGTLREDNRAINRSKIIYNSLDENIYYEYGFGIENIGFGNIKFFRVDFIWRSDMPYNFKIRPNSSISPSFGVRFGIRPKF